MTYRGRVEQGVIVLDQRNVLPEGAIVDVTPLPQESVGDALDKLAGTAQDLPSDLAKRHDHYRKERGG
jgi:hypothetical protein